MKTLSLANNKFQVTFSPVDADKAIHVKLYIPHYVECTVGMRLSSDCLDQFGGSVEALVADDDFFDEREQYSMILTAMKNLIVGIKKDAELAGSAELAIIVGHALQDAAKELGYSSPKTDSVVSSLEA